VDLCLVFLSIYLGVEWLCPVETLCSTFSRNFETCFDNSCTILHSHQLGTGSSSISPYSCQHLYFQSFDHCSYSICGVAIVSYSLNGGFWWAVISLSPQLLSLKTNDITLIIFVGPVFRTGPFLGLRES